MSDYAFVHDGKAYTPNGTTVAASDADAHNAAIERAELEAWQAKPDRMLVYFRFEPKPEPQRYLSTFRIAGRGTVRTWRGTVLGTITSARVYPHNFGGRFIAITVTGTNGAEYHGRASFDWGECVQLRKCKRESKGSRY